MPYCDESAMNLHAFHIRTSENAVAANFGEISFWAFG